MITYNFCKVSRLLLLLFFCPFSIDLHYDWNLYIGILNLFLGREYGHVSKKIINLPIHIVTSSLAPPQTRRHLTWQLHIELPLPPLPRSSPSSSHSTRSLSFLFYLLDKFSYDPSGLLVCSLIFHTHINRFSLSLPRIN
jgi:hypothetical protein